jgi:hypothetical protein
MHCSLLSLGCVFGFTPPQNQVKLTGLRALKIAQRRLRPEVRAKLLSVASARSNGNLLPDAWRFVFLDEATSGNCRVVTVAAKASSEHPNTVEAFSSYKNENVKITHPIPQGKLLIDSDKALEQTGAIYKLKDIHGAAYHLVQQKTNQEPCWILNFFGTSEEPVASFRIGARTGTVEAEKPRIVEPVRFQQLVSAQK